MQSLTRIAAATLLACLGVNAFAADYFVVVPVKGRTATPVAVALTLNPTTLPGGTFGAPYAGFDFKTVLQVTGDQAYNGSGVTWAATGLPSGLLVDANGAVGDTASPGHGQRELDGELQESASHTDLRAYGRESRAGIGH